MEPEISLKLYLKILLKRWKTFLAVALTIAVCGTWYTMRLSDYYRADAVILPKGDSNNSAMSMLSGKLGGVASLLGAPTDNAAMKLLMLFNSRSLSERVAARPDMKPLLTAYVKKIKHVDPNKQVDYPIEFLGEIAKGILKTLNMQEFGTIIVSGVAREPSITAPVVKVYLEELQKYANENELTDAKTNLNFIGKQLVQYRREYLKSGAELAKYNQNNPVSPTSSVLDVEINLNDLNPEIGKNLSEPPPIAILTDVPLQVHLKYLMQRYTVLMSVNDILTQQYAMARIEEAKEAINFQVIDEARVPDGPFKPDRPLILAVVGIASFFLALFAVFLKENFSRD